MNFKLKTYAEVVFSVLDIEKTAQLYTQHLGWETMGIFEGDATETAFWQLPSTCKTQQQILHFQGLNYGKIRLIKFENVPQKVIRSGGQTWDTGGILDIDLRVSDIEQTYWQMENLGWQGYTPVAEAEMGPFTVQEVLMRGPDGIVIAFVHRKNPPHPNPFNLNGCTSNVYLSAMMVHNLEAATHFFVNQLGFISHNIIDFKPEKEERTMFGLPHNLAHKVTVKLHIIGPEENREGLLDLVQLAGVTGEDFSSNALPPNRGILMYRFPVENIANYYTFVLNNGVIPEKPLSIIHLAPYNSVQIFAVRSPDGVWIEFFEKQLTD